MSGWRLREDAKRSLRYQRAAVDVMAHEFSLEEMGADMSELLCAQCDHMCRLDDYLCSSCRSSA